MKKQINLFLISIGLIVLIYLLTTFINMDFFRIMKSISVALTVLAILFSGTLGSGERQRGNYHSNPARTTKAVLDSWKILIFAVPFYLVLLLNALF